MKDDKKQTHPDSEGRDNVRYYGALGEAGITARIEALEREWDGETFIRTALTATGLTGMVMGLAGSRFWRVLAWLSLPALFAVSRGKWASEKPLLRFLGLRSRLEIQEEKYALKALRGDFKSVEIPIAVNEAMTRSSASAMDAVQA